MLTPFTGKVVNAPRESRINPRNVGTLNEVKAINKVADYVSRLGWNVVFERGGDEGIVPALRNVTVNSSRSKKVQLYTLLHEAGHACLFSQNDYIEKFSDGYVRTAGKKSQRSLRHRIDVLREEVAAWEKAEELISLLGIDVDMRTFRDDRNRCLMTYVDWVKE
jgi:hypothetical protein